MPTGDRLTWRRGIGLRAGRTVRAAVRMALALAASLAALAAAGCGPPPPQAPLEQENRVASAVTGIAAACGESYQQHVFSRHPAEESRLEAAAEERTTELAHVFLKNPAWIYQGETLRQVVALSVSYLRECDLPQAATLLVAETAKPALSAARQSRG